MRCRSQRDDDADLGRSCASLRSSAGGSAIAGCISLLRREGVVINRKKTQRLYREEKLVARHRRNRRRATGARAPTPMLALLNQRWSSNFGHDQTASGRRFRVLSIRRRCDPRVLGGGPRTRRTRGVGSCASSLI